MENITGCEVIEDLRQCEEYGEYMEKIGWKCVSCQASGFRCQVFVRRLGLVSIAKIQRVKLPVDWNKVMIVLKSERVVMCKLEPGDMRYQMSDIRYQLMRYGFHMDRWPLLETKTVRIDLKRKETEILAGFSKKTRYTLRKLLVVSGQWSVKVNQFDKFYEIWQKSSRRKKIWQPGYKEYNSLRECFGKKSFSLTVGDVAGALILMHKGTAYYHYAGATMEGNELDLPYLVVWKAMLEAKKRNCEVWDFEGIYDDRWPNKDWIGFSRFKKSFGGEEVEYPGSFIKWRFPF